MVDWAKPRPGDDGRLGEGDTWKDMPTKQPRTCRCGTRVTLNRTADFKTMPPLASTCKECTPKTLLLSYCSCDYCQLASDAIQDAREAHRRAA